MKINYPEVGICGLSCRLCTWYHKVGENRCGGCKSDFRLAVGCPFITCALKKKGIEFCWDCKEHTNCERWENHRRFSKNYDTFKCYQKLEEDIAFIQEHGVKEFERTQKIREDLLNEMLSEFNDGRSKNYFSVAATVLKINELVDALKKAKKQAVDKNIKEKAKILHSIIDEIANENGYLLKLRKYKESGKI